MVRTRARGGLYTIFGIGLALLPTWLVSNPLANTAALLQAASALLLVLVGVGYSVKPAIFVDSPLTSFLIAVGGVGVLLGFIGIFVL